MRLVWFVLPALAFAVVGCASGTKAGAVGQHTIVLTIANHESDDRDLAEYIAAVSRLSRGSIKLDLRAGWRPQESDYDRETIADVRGGKADLAKIAVGSLDRVGVGDFQAVTAPFLIDGLALEQKVLASKLPDQMLPSLQRLGVEGVAMLPGEPRRPFGLTRRLLSPSDYRDAVIGIQPSRLAAATLRALGATAQSYRPGELPSWAFDGAELDLATLEGNRYDTSGSSLTANVAFGPEAFVVVANDSVLTKLTSQQRAILREAGWDALGPAIARLHNDDRVEAGILCRRHHTTFVVATPAQVAALRAAVSPVTGQVERDARTRSFIHEIEAMKRRSFAERAFPCSVPRPPPKAATLLDGVWEMTASRAVAGEIDAGRYRMILRRGRLRAIRPWKNTGTFTVRGDIVAFRSSDGEYGVYRWNLFRDTLTLHYVPGREEGAPNPTFAPWHRVGS
jgi:TRAP-type C4-dicarboxylate transport system substrate-binding protein